ncbi:nuclear apoptosis-inducing factor 1-like [Haliotis rubra]|uniref:nuclear apoptosis-inducing factor 1-like n=1 Tax=Haliotis rubra TaxID=36100 RepID=UPI001EE55C14|nr:nuclear apoptosis-inducing factor 1-like [Haliotis rubra]
MSEEKKSRRSNFQASELDILVEEVTHHQSTLFGAFSATVTAKVKGRLWEAIAERINAVCATNRRAMEVRKKWNDYKCYVKKKSISLKKEQKLTGGGNAPANLTAIEEKVLSMIPTCQIDGVEGGMEVGLNDACPGISIIVSLLNIVVNERLHTEYCSFFDVPIHTETCRLLNTYIIDKIKEEDPLEKLVAIEERKVNKLDELTSIWKDFFLCTKAYQDRDLAIKEKILAMKEKEKELCDYSVFPTVNFPNEY